MSSSSIYSQDAFRNKNEYYNYTDPNQVDTTARVPYPYGFVFRSFEHGDGDTESGFYAFIDINHRHYPSIHPSSRRSNPN